MQDYPVGAEVSRADSDLSEFPHKELTRKIIGCAIKVHRELGPGYLESIYENALVHELTKQGLGLVRQRTVRVVYDGIDVGEHRIDILVEGAVVVELKSVDTLTSKHTAQLISTLKAVKAPVGLLVNFDEARLIDGIRRVVLSQR
jgi:GxxExxY protein